MFNFYYPCRCKQDQRFLFFSSTLLLVEGTWASLSHWVRCLPTTRQGGNGTEGHPCSQPYIYQLYLFLVPNNGVCELIPLPFYLFAIRQRKNRQWTTFDRVHPLLPHFLLLILLIPRLLTTPPRRCPKLRTAWVAVVVVVPSIAKTSLGKRKFAQRNVLRASSVVMVEFLLPSSTFLVLVANERTTE